MEVSADLHFYNDPCMDKYHSRNRTIQDYDEISVRGQWWNLSLPSLPAAE